MILFHKVKKNKGPFLWTQNYKGLIEIKLHLLRNMKLSLFKRRLLTSRDLHNSVMLQDLKHIIIILC